MLLLRRELFFELLSALLFVSVFLEPLSFSALFAVFLSELFFETFSELLSASSAADFFSKATLGLLTG